MTRTSYIARSLGALLMVACGPQVQLEDEGSGTAEASSTGAATTTTASPTTAETSVGTTLDPVDTTTTGVDPDDGSTTEPVLPEHCSQIRQDCPPAYKCMPYANDGGSSWNDTRCVPIVEDPSAPAEPCTVVDSGVSGEDDCDGSSMCWDVDPETLQGLCVPFCIGTEDEPTCANPCDRCSIAGDGVLALCFSGCDPLIQDCAPGQACYAIESYFACMPDASPEGTGIASPCEYINVCPPGLVCLNAESVPGCESAVGCCAPFCPATGADPCPGLLPGSSCVPWYEEGQGPPLDECLSAEPGVCVQE